MNKSLLLILILTLQFACKPAQWKVEQTSSTRIALDASTQAIADTVYIAYLKPFKQQVDAKMNVVIGRTEQTMRAHAPESLLSNLSADIYRKAASDYLKTEVDIAIANLGGLRTQIPAGNITVRKVFELMPFENELVILYLRGDKLNELCQYFASMDGEGVSGLRMKFQQKKAFDITINNVPIDLAKVYTVATNDYLAAGNDKMTMLAQNEKRINTNIKVRDMFLNYITSETAKGYFIQSQLDGRIQIIP